MIQHEKQCMIHSYRPDLAHYFVEINREWIERYFAMEAYDEFLLNHPQSEIIDKGGEVFFAELDGEIVGTCAMFYDDGEYELIKMGVRPSAQGKGVAKQMVAHCIEFARIKQVPKIIILTSDQLFPACTLYRKMGFVDAPVTAKDRTKYDRVSARFEMEMGSAERQAG